MARRSPPPPNTFASLERTHILAILGTNGARNGARHPADRLGRDCAFG
jgi:hypothetical protein